MRWVVMLVVVFWSLGSGARADVTIPPVTVVFVVDRSIPVEKLEVVTRSLAEAVAQLDAADRVAVISAGPTPTVEASLQLATPGAKKKIAAAIARITWTERASLETALAKAAAVVKADRRPSRHVVMVTNSNVLTDLEKPVRILHEKGVDVSMVTYQGANETQLAYLGAVGGGGHAVHQKPAELVDSFVQLSGSGSVDLPLAVVLVLDRSGSMSGPKLEAAKEAARVVAEVLAPNDTIAVVAFDSESQVYVRPQRAANRMRISAEISRIQAGGGTNIYPGLKEAFDLLLGVADSRRMVILLSDGEAPSDGIVDLVQDMRASRISVSAVGLQGADRNLLSMIAGAGDGRLYMVEDLGSLPRIFMKETAPRKR